MQTTNEENISLEIIDRFHYQDKYWSYKAKYLKETQVEIRPKGDKEMLKFVWIF